MYAAGGTGYDILYVVIRVSALLVAIIPGLGLDPIYLSLIVSVENCQNHVFNLCPHPYG